MARSDDDTQKLQSFWLQVFNNSRANGANHRDENLPDQGWSWPTDTYLQRRRQKLRVNPADKLTIVAQNDTVSQCTDSAVVEEPALDHARQSSEVVTVDKMESELPQQAEQATIPEAQATLIECDETDERFSWLAAPNP